MPHYERGVYEPTDEVRVFDGSEDDEDVEGSRLPLLIVLAAIDPRKIGVPVEIAQSETFSLYRIVIIVALTGCAGSAALGRVGWSRADASACWPVCTSMVAW